MSFEPDVNAGNKSLNNPYAQGSSESPPQQSPPRQGNHYQQNNNYGGGGAQRYGGGGGGGKFKRKEKVITDPEAVMGYVPLAFFVDREFSNEIKSRMIRLIERVVVSKKYIVRINGDDKDFVNTLTSNFPSDQIEIYVPWRNFNEFETKHYYNDEEHKILAKRHFPVWETVSDVVKAFLCRNVRMVHGDKNNSCLRGLITWSPDGASILGEITRETGKASHILKVATTANVPCFNLQAPTSMKQLATQLQIHEE